MRPKCNKCNKNPAAINYIRNNKTHYRKMCRICLNDIKKQNELINQLLIKSGYRKKKNCDRCNFISKHPSQLKIIYLDGNRVNVGRDNLRTYCLNCLAEISSIPQNKKIDLVPDY
jgi:hypothetical protein